MVPTGASSFPLLISKIQNHLNYNGNKQQKDPHNSEHTHEIPPTTINMTSKWNQSIT